MELLRDSVPKSLFDKISRFFPKNFKEYQKFFGEAMEEAAAAYGIARVECRVSVPYEMRFAEIIPEYALLFQRREEAGAETEPLRFRYPLERSGEILFFLLVDKGKGPGSDGSWMLEVIFRQFYYILNSLVLSAACKKFIITDYETGAPNVRAFFQFGNSIIAREQIHEYTALYFNIHNFKSVHKSLTYLEGNKVLERYCQIVTEAVTRDEIVARLGGDNFVALIYDRNIDYFFDLIQNMIVNYEKDGKEQSFWFGATIGAVKLTDEKNAGEIMMHASAAYQTARENRTSFSYYDQSAGVEMIERKILLSKFAGAVKDREFFVVYQPKVGVKSRTLLGAEALVRWRQGDGCIMPGNFIPVLEKDGCITVLDFYVLEEVCRFLGRLISEGLEPVKISVNFSKRHLANNKLVEEIVEVIDRYGVPHHYIEIELTESEDYHNNSVMQEIVGELNMQGINTALDDFGTGYSSLAMLNTLQFDELKIDRSFIPQDQITEDDKSLLMLKGVVSLAKSLGLRIVAEGVETPAQLAIIESMDCDMIQGYIFDKPIAESEFIRRIEQKVYVLG